MNVELHPEAADEFLAQFRYYDEREPGLGQRFYREVILCLDWIAANATVPRLRKDHYRVNMKGFPFYVAYAIEAELIWVLAIAHGHLRPDYWRNRFKFGS